MKLHRLFPRVLASLAMAMLSLAAGSIARAQVTINEIVEDEQDFESTDVAPDTREFVELYNAGATPVDISGWTLSVTAFETGSPTATDTIPNGSTIPAGGYFVIGQAGVPNVNFTPVAGELWDNTKTIYELRNPNLPEGQKLVDAVALETFRGNELINLTQEQMNQVKAGETAGLATTTGGWWGQIESNNDGPTAIYPNLPLSIGRYLNGRDNNNNGRDFGMIPATPGASNNLTQSPAHVAPNVDALAVGTVLRDQYFASFKLPTVVSPTTAGSGGVNPSATLSASPQGGNAIIAWDETGGGNAAYSDNYVNKFDIWAYVDSTALGVATVDTAPQSEATIYGIGTTDMFFGTPNSAGLLGPGLPGGNIASSANGSTGVGWLIQRRELFNGGTPVTNTVLQLIDMNDGGDGVVEDAPDWDVKQTIDLTGTGEGWKRLSIEYDPSTGAVIAKVDAQTFNFNTTTNLVGNFYIGYRENLPGVGNAGRPPTYDSVAAAPVNDADFDNDGDEDGADFLVWQRNTGGAGGNNLGDANGNGQVNDADFAIWKAQFGPPGGSLGAVPEPTAGALCLVAAVLAFAARRK
jgi:hypothetical protein